MKVSLLEPIGVPDEVISNFSKELNAKGHEFVYYDTKTTNIEELKKRSEDSDIIIIANNPYPGEVVKHAKKLKMLSVAFTGIDHIDTQACKDKGVMICNAAGYSDETVAELIIGMAIGALRNLPKSTKAVKNGGTSAGIGGREICGRTVGIIGLGRIGKRVAKLFQAFGANVIAYNRSKSAEAINEGIVYKSLEEVLQNSDIISLNLPLNSETRGFITSDHIYMMKKDAIFINCARGPIVDNKALAEALKTGKLGCVCADVFDMEPPLPSDYPLLSAPNTILTPHQAFISEESMLRRAEIVFKNVLGYLDGNPQNVCSL